MSENFKGLSDGEIFVEAAPGVVMLTTHAEYGDSGEPRHATLEFPLEPAYARALAALLVQEADIADPKNDWVMEE